MKKSNIFTTLFILCSFLTISAQSVIVYDQGNFQGAGILLAEGTYPMSNFNFNDRASSIRIPQGYYATLFESNTSITNVGYGRRIVLDSDLSDLTVANFNDITSHITVAKKVLDSPVEIFENVNFTGRSRKLSLDILSFPNTSGGYRFYTPFDFNDVVSSIKIDSGYAIIAYEHANEGGGFGTAMFIDATTTDLTSFNMNDKISFIKIIKYCKNNISDYFFGNYGLVDPNYGLCKEFTFTCVNSGISLPVLTTDGSPSTPSAPVPITYYGEGAMHVEADGKLKADIWLVNSKQNFDYNKGVSCSIEFDACAKKLKVVALNAINESATGFGFNNGLLYTFFQSSRFQFFENKMAVFARKEKCNDPIIFKQSNPVLDGSSFDNKTDTKAEDYTLSPNPATNATDIELPTTLQGQAVEIMLLDALGKMIRKDKIESVSTNRHTLSLEGLANGQYFIQIKPQGEKGITKKLVVLK